jgi:hypothetical protein
VAARCHPERGTAGGAAPEGKKLKYWRRDRVEAGRRIGAPSPFLSLVPEDSDPELVTRVNARDPGWKRASASESSARPRP